MEFSEEGMTEFQTKSIEKIQDESSYFADSTKYQQ